MVDATAGMAFAHKPRPTRAARGWRFLLSALDPRAYLHGLRVLNHYNQTHVIPRRALACGPGAAISPTAQFAHADRITLGARAHVGSGCILWAGPGRGAITAGDDLLLGPNVVITAANYRFRDASPVSAQAMDEASIAIGNDVWVGAGAMLLPGCRIGDGAVIAAGAIVRGTVNAGDIVAGVPARKVGTRWT